MLSFASTTGQVSDDLVHEPEEPPDDQLHELVNVSPQKPGFLKQIPTRMPVIRRESLLTRQLQPRDSDVDQYTFGPARRAISNSSVADLTSDNELTSPGTHASSPSPPLPPLAGYLFVPPMEKHFAQVPEIAQLAVDDPEHKVESGLGRRRCITFACGKKPEPVKETKPTPAADEAPTRKCTITFNCPTRTKVTPSKPLALSSRHLSPAPPKIQKSPKSPKSPRPTSKNRRGSDMTITTTSPIASRKSPMASPTKVTSVTAVTLKGRNKYAEDADEDKLEAKRFHEFAVNSRADEDWTEEATCHRKRLTIKDTLHKENVIRQMGEEVAEEEEDEDEDLDDDALLDELDEEDEDEDDDHLDEDDDDDNSNTPHPNDGSISDGGFDTDDEQGFANSSDEGDDSDFEWWVPGRSTAATSTDHLDQMRPIQRRSSDSSLESAREANISTLKHQKRKSPKSQAVKINRPPTPELPDSTDFVCGTLDEDRPLEQAYKTCLEQRKAAKHKVTPQDIDPTFPTSDPEIDDEEDEEDEVDDDGEDDQPLLMHGPIELNDDRGRRHAQHGNGKKKSKSPPLRLKSPAPIQRIHTRSPGPGARRKSLRSPPPPVKARHRSPAPRKLFGQSPRRMRSPAPHGRPMSPPPSREEGTPRAGVRGRGVDYLASRPAPTRVTSLPRVTTATRLQAMATPTTNDEDEDGNGRRVRGAIDIVKGLERKRLRRKEKLYQKHCQQKKKDGERKPKPKPGKGAERMRELGLELAAYRGKTAEHVLSF